MTERVEKIRALIDQALSPQKLEIIDDSQAHAGHAGTRESGGGHFFVYVVADAFVGKGLIQRHQLVYKAVGNLMKTDIHALSIKAHSPDELT